MAINISQIFLPLLDEVYKAEAKTSILDGDETTVRKGHNGEIKIAKLDMDGLGDFSRSSGYTSGDVSLTWETVKYDKERSQDLRIDRLDNDENVVDAFGKLAGEFVRTKVVPETDAARIAKIATAAINANNSTAEDLSTGAQVISSLRSVTSQMDNAEVPTDSRILFIDPALKGAIDDTATTTSREVLNRFSDIIEVPATRMNTAITLNDGTSSYGFAPTAGGYKINYLVVEKSAAVTALDEFVKYFTPDQDQNGDAHVMKYRNYNLYGHVYENKTAGVFASHVTTANQ